MNDAFGHRLYDAVALRAAMKLYAVTDRRWLRGRKLTDCVAEAIAGGATFLQLREKEGADAAEVEALAREILTICRQAGVPFVIDDDVTLAKAVGADGVHVGQSDTGCREARATLGPDAIIGVSASTLAEALEAERAGADYLGVGAMFSTATKTDADLVSLETLRAITSAVTIPVVAIGGLDVATIPTLASTGIDGVAVVSALFAAPDVEAAAEKLTSVIDATAF